MTQYLGLPARLARLGLWVALAATLVGFPRGASAQSENVELLSNLNPYSTYNDVWGYVSPGGVELAMVGFAGGTMFVNATDPQNPVELLVVPGAASIWRDIKTWDHYAYIVSEGGGGLQIVDLDDPLVPLLVAELPNWFQTAHNIFIDEQTGYAYVVGADGNITDDTHILDLSNPTLPSLVATIDDFYIHDIYVRDGVAYAAAIYNSYLATIDVSNLPSYQVLSINNFTDATHNTWLTQDGNYCLTTDETGSGHLRVFDVQDPSAPVHVAEWLNPEEPGSSIHNVLVVGDLAFTSWYTSGLQIFDVRVPTNPQRVGYYDTHPGSTGFNGAWGVYAGQPSGNIYVSDIQTGLYIFEFTANFGTLEGIVTDSESGLPIEGATVRVDTESVETTTDATGFYSMGLSPGAQDAEIEAFGYVSVTLQVTILPLGITDGSAALDPLPKGGLGGFVREQGTGTPLEGAQVQIVSTPLVTTSAADGSYAFADVPVGSYTARASLLGYGSKQAPVEVVQGFTMPKDFLLAPAFYADDIETNQGWVLGDPGDGATTGQWVWVDPVGTSQGGNQVQPEDDHTPNGVLCFVTGNGPVGGAIGTADVDNGATTLYTPVFDLSSLSDPVVRYHRWYSNDEGTIVDDDFLVQVSSTGGAPWIALETLSVTENSWEAVELRLVDFIPLTSQVRFRFIAQDFGGGSIVEAGVDDFEIYDSDAIVDVAEEQVFNSTRLLASFPNPVPRQQGSTLRFELGQRATVALQIYDTRGRLVREVFRGARGPGVHGMLWDGRDASGRMVPSGIYFQSFETEQQRSSGKLVVIR